MRREGDLSSLTDGKLYRYSIEVGLKQDLMGEEYQIGRIAPCLIYKVRKADSWGKSVSSWFCHVKK